MRVNDDPRVVHNMDDYSRTYAAYKPDVPDFFNFGFDVLDKWAETPDHKMMLWVGEDGDQKDLTYAYFRDRSNQLANAFRKLGLSKGENVMIVMSRVPEWWECMLGMIKAGIIAVPGTTQLTPKDIAFRLEAAKISAVITDSDNAPKFEEARKSYRDLKTCILVDNDREGWINYEKLLSDCENTSIA